ncbi:MAG: ABC transporter permease subunit [Ilumatobacter sp.]|jgi:neutral amino acid transport system permease protein|uniref:branched-chain amino acid ABC transporter permease n=1 Tax=Ilumatobacter sp. TaxID=1967498 RepID=UPI00391DA1A7
MTWRRVVLGLFVGLLGVLSFSPPASAGSEPVDPDAAPIADEEIEGTSIGGTLRTQDADGEDVFVEGVGMTVRNEAGEEIGSAVTDAEGVWRVELPGAGIYEVELAEETLPDGVPLRNEGRNTLPGIDVDEGESKNTLFPLGEATESTDSTIRAVQLFVDGIKLGLIIAMCAIGLSLIYGTTGLTNFAHGEIVTFGALIAFIVHMVYPERKFGIPGTNSLIFGGLVAVVFSALAGWLVNEYIWKRLRKRGASLIAALVVSIGLSIFFRYVYLYQHGGRARFYRDYQIQERISFGWFSLAPKDLFIILFSIFVLVLVGLALQKTRAGKAMRAVADNRDLAESSGIDVESVIKWVWMAGAGLAGLGGVLFGMTESVNWEMGFRVLLLMFAGVTLGGLGTAYGALFGSLIVGIFIQMITLPTWFPNDMKNVGALLALVLILLVRPQGLLGRAERIG